MNSCNMRFVLWEIITSYALWLLVLGKILQSQSQWCETIPKKIQCQRVSDVKQEKRESKMHTHTSFKCPSIYKPGSVDCTTLMSMMSWELYRSTPPWLEVSRTSWSSFNKCLHPSTASRFGVSASLAKNHQNPTLFVKNLRLLKKHLQDHKSSLDFVFFEQTAWRLWRMCLLSVYSDNLPIFFFTPW